MIEYLKDYLSVLDYEILLANLDKKDLELFEGNETNIKEVLNFLKEYGIKDFKYLLINRPDICLEDINILKEKINRLDKNLVLYIIENDIDSLLDFNI